MATNDQVIEFLQSQIVTRLDRVETAQNETNVHLERLNGSVEGNQKAITAINGRLCAQEDMTGNIEMRLEVTRALAEARVKQEDERHGDAKDERKEARAKIFSNAVKIAEIAALLGVIVALVLK